MSQPSPAKKKGLNRLHDLFQYNLRSAHCGRCGNQLKVATTRMFREMRSIFKAAVNDETVAVRAELEKEKEKNVKLEAKLSRYESAASTPAE